MLRSLTEMVGYKISATDGEVGRVVQFFLDDERWAVRYLVTETGHFFGSRRVLVSPISVRALDSETRRVQATRSVEKFNNAPGIESEQPVTRRRERENSRYYGYLPYWEGSGCWGNGSVPASLALSGSSAAATDPNDESNSVHVRTTRELRGYRVHGSDGAVGQVASFIVDDLTWEVRYLVVDTSGGWFGKKVLVAPSWAYRVSWANQTIYLDVARSQITAAPAWKASLPIDRGYEERLHIHYGRTPYWEATPSVGATRFSSSVPPRPTQRGS